MNAWKVNYTEHAEHDLREIYEYIAFFLLEPEIAKKQISRIIDAVAKLNQMPLRYQIYEKEPWCSKGLWILQVDNSLIFFLTVKAQETVTVITGAAISRSNRTGLTRINYEITIRMKNVVFK
ncbi:type II toxin-antitoxin system RelE/ParE family toxin [Bacillaceae bacterium Marseille-Q3522]|nr:type II toxin-antitoxin system RelE/ParE family toxin [Bacillaceae bacterium Marseille-Q3522]